LHRRFAGDDLHSGATARDSHPLPYSSRSERDTQTHLKEPRNVDVPLNCGRKLSRRLAEVKSIAGLLGAQTFRPH
jgi:hypothetical protein